MKAAVWGDIVPKAGVEVNFYTDDVVASGHELCLTSIWWNLVLCGSREVVKIYRSVTGIYRKLREL